MGRVAGPLTKQGAINRWRREVSQRRLLLERERLRPERPVVSPPAMRRRLALLWVFEDFYPDGMVIGAPGRPPYTPDMRWLVGQGLLTLSRPLFDHGRKWNVLQLTEGGKARLVGVKLNDFDKRWIHASLAHGMVR